MTTKSHAGSATSIDLARLNAIADRCDDRGMATTAAELREMVSAALARATPQHPEALADGSLSVPRNLLARCLSSLKAAVTFGETRQGRPPSQTCLFEIEDLEAVLAGIATPQHSVTEQAREFPPLPETTLEAKVAGYFVKVYGVQHMRDYARAYAAQPLASTAATQPEQASTEAAKLAEILRGMCEGGGPEEGVDIYAGDFQAPDGDVYVVRAAELLEEFAALAIPASTAPTQPEDITCGQCGGSGWVVRDPGIGTEQECFSCDGKGQIDGDKA